MSDITLKDLLKQYEKKRELSQNNLEEKKYNLYKDHPRLKSIEDELNKLYLKKSKNILFNKSDDDSIIIENNIERLKNEYNNILYSLGLNENYLLPNYDCNICKDTGYYIDNSGKTMMCSCLKQALIDINYNKANIGNINKENFNNFNINVFSDEINQNKFNSSISPRENIKIIKKICMNFISNFDNPDEKNLLFTGNTGLRENIFIKLCC